MSRKIPQIIEEQIRLWTRKNITKSSMPGSGPYKPIITVSREFGAKGARLAKELSHVFGFKVWDKEILGVISEKLGRSEAFLEALDEARRGLLEDTIFGFMNQRGTNLNYLITLVKVVRALEDYGNNIIVGRGANYICQNPRSFHIRICCPLNARIERYAREHGLTKAEASDVITLKDQERQQFAQYNFNRDVNNASDYDLVLNSNTYTIEQMTELVKQAYQFKLNSGTSIKKHTSRSVNTP